MTATFDPSSYVSKYGGVVVYEVGEKQSLFSQGDVADSIFSFAKAECSSRLCPPRVRRASSQCSMRALFVARDA